MIFRANIARWLCLWLVCRCGTRTEGVFHQAAATAGSVVATTKHCVNAPSRACTRMVSSSSISASTEGNVVRILALHGSEGTGERFRKVFEPWQQSARVQFGMDLQINTLDAPIPKGRGFAWWSMPPLVRSFNATEYESFDISANQVVQEILTGPQNGIGNNHDASSYDLVIGFSQGAILGTSLLALNKISKHPKLGYIFIGGAWPNPFTRELESLTTDTLENRSRVLLVVGEQDQINPPEHNLRIQKYLEAGGYCVTRLPFLGGHLVPTRQDETLDAILSWMIGESN